LAAKAEKMKNKNFHRIFWSTILFMALSTVFLPGIIQWTSSAPEITDLPPLLVHQESSPKMESVLYRLVQMYQNQGLETARQFAELREIEMEDNLLRVITEAQSLGMYFDTRIMASIVSYQIENLGGIVEGTSRGLVQSLIPLEALGDLIYYPSVKYIRLPLKSIPLFTSEGVDKTGAAQWQSLASYRQDSPAKVCVLDSGFQGYKALLGSELPSQVEIRSFRSDGNFNPSKHGTACAEIIHDMAPQTPLWLVNFNTEVEHHQAVNWIINQGIEIVSYSMGWFNAGAGDGTGPICEDVQRAADNGIVWVSAAGNHAEGHWGETFRDKDGDNWHNFSGNDEILSFSVNANQTIHVYMSWDDWGTWDGADYSGSGQDYDLFLLRWNGSTWVEVDRSTNRQTGTQWPTESITRGPSNQASTWGIAINRFNSNRNVKFNVFILGNSSPVEYNKPHGSLAIPADSPSALAVGATSWQDDSYHAYSSRGPTADKRIKPDIVAPSGVSGSSYGELGFYGTSAATPHVAGAFALLRAKTPFTLTQIRDILLQRSLDLGSPGKDNLYGMGRLSLTR
jgi:subtilisin family serine protease